MVELKKYDKIKRVGHDQNKKMFENGGDRLVVKEKMDGANFRWTYNEDGEPVFGSKNVKYTIDGEPDYSENVDGRFTDAIKFVKEEADVEGFEDQYGGLSRYTFFGENMVQHSLDYDWRKVPQVLGFDVYDHEEGEYVDPELAAYMFDELGIKTVPVVHTNLTVSEFKERHEDDGFEVPESKYRGEGKAEGVVIINVDREEPDLSGFNYRAKTVTEEFKEKHKERTGARQSVEAVHDYEKVVSKYCTDNRVRKKIHRMQNEGRDLGMELMENKGSSDGLPIRVAKDIVKEEYDDLVTSNWEVDFKEFRSAVAKRCVHVLRQEIEKNV